MEGTVPTTKGDFPVTALWIGLGPDVKVVRMKILHGQYSPTILKVTQVLIG